MRTGIGLLAGWLLAALLVLAEDGRLPGFLAGAVSGSLLALGLGALVRQQLAPSRYNRPSLPERYRMADDLGRPLADVVAVAEQEASARWQEAPDGHVRGALPTGRPGGGPLARPGSLTGGRQHGWAATKQLGR